MTACDVDAFLDCVLAADLDTLREEARERETIPAPAAYEHARTEARTAPTAEQRTVARLEMVRLRKGAK